MALPLTRSGRGPSSAPSTDTLNRLCEPRLSCTLGMEVGEEVERHELDQHIEADVAGDAEADAAAYSDASAPNCMVLGVIAK